MPIFIISTYLFGMKKESRPEERQAPNGPESITMRDGSQASDASYWLSSDAVSFAVSL